MILIIQAIMYGLQAILVKRITDEIKDTSNYADKLDLRIKTLEGTEGSPGDISKEVQVIFL
jgi:hypothetical protein